MTKVEVALLPPAAAREILAAHPDFTAEQVDDFLAFWDQQRRPGVLWSIDVLPNGYAIQRLRCSMVKTERFGPRREFPYVEPMDYQEVLDAFVADHPALVGNGVDIGPHGDLALSREGAIAFSQWSLRREQGDPAALRAFLEYLRSR